MVSAELFAIEHIDVMNPCFFKACLGAICHETHGATVWYKCAVAVRRYQSLLRHSRLIFLDAYPPAFFFNALKLLEWKNIGVTWRCLFSPPTKGNFMGQVWSGSLKGHVCNVFWIEARILFLLFCRWVFWIHARITRIENPGRLESAFNILVARFAKHIFAGNLEIYLQNFGHLILGRNYRPAKKLAGARHTNRVRHVCKTQPATFLVEHGSEKTHWKPIASNCRILGQQKMALESFPSKHVRLQRGKHGSWLPYCAAGLAKDQGILLVQVLCTHSWCICEGFAEVWWSTHAKPPWTPRAFVAGRRENLKSLNQATVWILIGCGLPVISPAGRVKGGRTGSLPISKLHLLLRSFTCFFHWHAAPLCTLSPNPGYLLFHARRPPANKNTRPAKVQ